MCPLQASSDGEFDDEEADEGDEEDEEDDYDDSEDEGKKKKKSGSRPLIPGERKSERKRNVVSAVSFIFYFIQIGFRTIVFLCSPGRRVF